MTSVDTSSEELLKKQDPVRFSSQQLNPNNLSGQEGGPDHLSFFIFHFSFAISESLLKDESTPQSVEINDK